MNAAHHTESKRMGDHTHKDIHTHTHTNRGTTTTATDEEGGGYRSHTYLHVLLDLLLKLLPIELRIAGRSMLEILNLALEFLDHHLRAIHLLLIRFDRTLAVGELCLELLHLSIAAATNR